MDRFYQLESNEKRNQRREFNLAAFGRTFEPGETPPTTTKLKRKEITKERYDEMVSSLREYKRSGGLLGINLVGYQLQDVNVGPNGTPTEHLLYRGQCKKYDFRIVVHQEMVFDAVYSIHETSLHKKGVMRGIAGNGGTLSYIDFNVPLLQKFQFNHGGTAAIEKG